MNLTKIKEMKITFAVEIITFLVMLLIFQSILLITHHPILPMFSLICFFISVFIIRGMGIYFVDKLEKEVVIR